VLNIIVPIFDLGTG